MAMKKRIAKRIWSNTRRTWAMDMEDMAMTSHLKLVKAKCVCVPLKVGPANFSLIQI